MKIQHGTVLRYDDEICVLFMHPEDETIFVPIWIENIHPERESSNLFVSDLSGFRGDSEYTKDGWLNDDAFKEELMHIATKQDFEAFKMLYPEMMPAVNNHMKWLKFDELT